MKPEKIVRFARNMQKLDVPLRVEQKGCYIDRCGNVVEVTDEVLTLEVGAEMEWIPVDRVRWIGVDYG